MRQSFPPVGIRAKIALPAGQESTAALDAPGVIIVRHAEQLQERLDNTVAEARPTEHGQADQGLKQMMDRLNLSRLSHGRARGRDDALLCDEAMVCARTRGFW